MSTRIPSTEAPPSLRYVPRYWGAPRYINLDGTRLLFTTNDVAQLRTADALFQKDPSGLPADWGWLCADGQSFLVQRGFFLQRTDLQGRAVGPRLEAGTVSEDGRYVAVRRSTAVEIFDTASGETRSILLTLVPGEITALHGDRDGRHFAVADGNRLRVVVARSTSDASPVAGTVFDTPSVRSPREKVAFSPDGRYLAAITAADASAEGVLHLVEVGTGRRLDVPKGRADDFAFSPDAILVAGAESVQIWDLARETVRGELRGPGNVKDIVVSPDGQHGLTVGADNRLTAWDLASGESGKPVELPSEPWRVAFAPAGDRAVVFSGDWVHLLTVDWLHLTVEGSTRHAAARWSPFESLGWPVLLDGGKGVRFLDRGTAPGTVEVRDLRFEGEPGSTTEKPALPTRKELERRLGLQFETALGALVSTGATRAVPAPPNPADPVQAEAALE
jgi:WD40 repeat protein